MAKIQPLHNKIVVRRNKPKKYTGILYIPEAALEPRTDGVVVAVGPGAYKKDGQRHSMSVAVGDQVLFPPGTGTGIDITVDGEELVLLDENQLVSKVI